MAKFQITPEDIEYFLELMKKEGFRIIEKGETYQNFKRLGIIPQKKIKGREIGLRYDANRLTVIVWTSFLEKEQKQREIDAIWVLILKDDTRLYTRKVYRTKNWMKNTFYYAYLAKTRVKYRPLCPICHAYTKIKMGGKVIQNENEKIPSNNFGARYFVCNQIQNHPDKKPVFISWDEPLKNLAPKIKEKLEKFQKVRRKARAYYRKKRKEEGKISGISILKRKKYIISKPQNKNP